MIKLFTFIVLFFLSVYLNIAQEVLTPLKTNPVKAGHLNESDQKSSTDNQQDTIILPFFDDFTNKGPYADMKLWADSFVFVNSSFGHHPKTYGVATFDALDQSGKVYEEAESNYYQFEADFLTSLPIRLDSVFIDDTSYLLSPEDSVILSFYYQPQGKGIAPIERDSLVLQFLRAPEDKDREEIWETVWSTTGESLDSFSDNDFPFFKRVMISIEDGEYFRNDFRFRFKNYASFPADKTPVNYAGNRSIWNIDYVYLNSNRSVADTFYYDIAFVEPAQSILNKYTSMPWSHYIADPQSQLKENFDVVFSNLDDITYNYSYRYYITDENNELLRNYSGGTWNIAPFYESGYQDYPPHTNPQLIANPLPTAQAEQRTFYIYHVIREGAQGDSFQRNDTISYTQVFADYYSYDDGVPEAGYGLSGWMPQGAYRFVLPEPDRLESVSFYFNHTKSDDNVHPFHLKIWKSLDPEVVLYESEVFSPEFEDELLQFVNYPLSESIQVSDTIYIGWSQLTSDFINIGFDVNNDSGSELFYNVDGNWQQSMFSGALMIRPKFQYSLSAGSVENVRNELTVYPNPVHGSYINISTGIDLTDNAVVQIYDLQGRLLKQIVYSDSININELSRGTYIIRVLDPGKEIAPVRFIVF